MRVDENGRRSSFRKIISNLILASSISLLACEAKAEFVCGSLNIFAQNIQWMRDFAKAYGFAETIGSKEIQCGMDGEEFRVCRKCDKDLSAENFEKVKPMLGKEKVRRWISRWRNEYRTHNASVDPLFFDAEKKMGHVNADETPGAFAARVNANWGESYLFLHRELYKMMQFELTVSGQPCFGPRSSLPSRADDSSWPSPMGNEAQKLLEQTNANLKAIESHLNSMPLNQLGAFLEMASKNLAQIYKEPEAASKAKCQGDEMTNEACDNLISNASSQVNQNYWKAAAYMDSFVGKWLRANNYDTIAKDCAGKPRCYQWKGTYTASYPF